MGNKGAKKPASATLSKKDLDFLVKQTGLPKENIQAVFTKFSANNPDHVLDRKDFIKLFDELRPECADVLRHISDKVFDAFGKDNGVTINFHQFLIAYALTAGKIYQRYMKS